MKKDFESVKCMKSTCKKCGHTEIFHQIDDGKVKCVDCDLEGKSCNRFYPFY